MTTSTTAASVQTIDPCTDARWEALARSDRGSVFSSPPWIRAVSATYGFEVGANVVVTRDGEAAAGLVYADVDDVRGRRIVSFPFSDRVDPIVTRESEWAAVVRPLLEVGVPVTIRCLRARAPLADDRFTTIGTAAWHGTDLVSSENELFEGFAATARRNIRAASRQGVTVRFGSDLDDVRAFHRLHVRLRKRKYRLLAQPLELFERLWSEFSATGSILVGLASHEGDVIAGGLYLLWGEVLYYKFGASVPERLSVRPNELLAWESICRGRALGCRLYDWGLSDLDQPGLVAFKRKFATTEGVITSRRHRPPGLDDRRDAQSLALIGQLVELLTRDDVPDEVTRRAGEIAYGVFC